MDAAVGEAHEDRFPPSVSLIEGSARRIREARRALYGLQAGIDGIIQGVHSLDASAVPATGTRSSESESQLHGFLKLFLGKRLCQTRSLPPPRTPSMLAPQDPPVPLRSTNPVFGFHH